VRTLIACSFLLAACGGGKPASQGQRPEAVATATFEALRVGGIAPLEPYLMTPEEARKVMGVVLDDSAERERLDRVIASLHERLDVDWDTAKAGATRVKYDAMGQGARLTLEIVSDQGRDTVEIEVTKIGRRFVFQEVRHAKGAAKQAAPESTPEPEPEDDEEGR